ncbi:hypothetical protein GCM10010156_48790 [Planobispora rosea]|uniref:Uncharacterized protein n=1 Tax=Planobispora rosea TaxID=35762 RepID=A0A8J3WEH6_PLARO|nr:hypothetical protein [Planobispora rosea]GGS84421.1 hypothetical protein GCM10010156_48790 [Planobispora rosea]GIH86390.1 hypothetical protein Pro02_47980 [Planobispora rosea]
MAAKETITVTLDPELVKYARSQIGGGDARSLSAYVNDALAAKVQQDRRRRAKLLALAAEADEDRVRRIMNNIERQAQAAQ